jgi:hypothetical protein
MPVASPIGTTGLLDVRYLVALQITSVAFSHGHERVSTLLRSRCEGGRPPFGCSAASTHPFAASLRGLDLH